MDLKDIVLSPSQEKAADSFRRFVRDPDARTYVLSGYAGSGKSFLVKAMIEIVHQEARLLKLIQPDYRVPDFIFTATTNKAANVLNEMAGTSLEQKALTIHQLLGLTVYTDYSTGHKTLVKKPKKAKHVPNLYNQLVIIDESSMINQDLLKYIIEAIKTTSIKVVFVGDAYQLPPVNEDVCPIFEEAENINFLTDIQRQAADSDIIMYAHKYREVLDNPELPWPSPTADSPDIITYTDPLEFRKSMLETFIKGKKEDYLHTLKYLSWTNKSVNGMNKVIREALGFSGTIMQDEVLVANSMICTNGKGNIDAPTDSSWKVMNISNGEKQLKEWMEGDTEISYIPCYVLELWPLGSDFDPFDAYMPKDWAQLRKVQKAAKLRKDWATVYAIDEQFADLRPGFAQTIHKSQGSTYNEVFIDVNDIDRSSDWQTTARLMYVALTRARFKVHLLGDLSAKLTMMSEEKAQKLFT